MAKCIGCGKCIVACPLGAIEDADNPEPKPVPHEPIIYTCDALIIGAGGSGMIAACRIAEETGKKVIVLEKTKKSGCGALHVAGPLSVVDTRAAVKKGARPVLPEHIKQVIDSTNGELSPGLVENTLNALPRFFEWLSTFAPVDEKFVLRKGGKKEPGPEKPDDTPNADIDMPPMPGNGIGGGRGPSKPEWLIDTKSLNTTSHAFHNAGQLIMENLFQYAKTLNITILQETKL